MALEELLLNPDVLGGSFLFAMISFVITFGMSIFMMYLNWKQSRVNNQMQELINEVKEIKALLEKKKK